MKTQKLTFKDKKDIVIRVAAGEKQADVALDFGVTQGYLSKIVKQSRAVAEKLKRNASISKALIDASRKTPIQLQNRYRQIHIELKKKEHELQQRHLHANSLQRSIETESAKPDSIRNEDSIITLKKQLTWCQDTRHIMLEMARLYREGSAILQTFVKRNIRIPVIDSLPQGII